jgi:hypothetical protein
LALIGIVIYIRRWVWRIWLGLPVNPWIFATVTGKFAIGAPVLALRRAVRALVGKVHPELTRRAVTM